MKLKKREKYMKAEETKPQTEKKETRNERTPTYIQQEVKCSSEQNVQWLFIMCVHTIINNVPS